MRLTLGYSYFHLGRSENNGQGPLFGPKPKCKLLLFENMVYAMKERRGPLDCIEILTTMIIANRRSVASIRSMGVLEWEYSVVVIGWNILFIGVSVLVVSRTNVISSLTMIVI